MDKLSIEKKAKAYDETIERAKKVLLDCTSEERKVVEYITPELKELEDEEIRKDIIRCIKGNMPDNDFRKKYIAWLEGQGAKVSAIEGFETEFERQVSGLIASAVNKEYEYNQGYVKWTANALLNYAKHELEKQGEQKPYGQRQECVDCQFNYAGECKGSCAMKRGEQKPAYTKKYDFHGMKFIPKFAKGDIIKDKKRDEVSTIEDFSYDTGLYTHTYGQFPITIQDNYEIIEQNPTDKVEPKFKVGDTIRNKITNEVFTIINRCISLEYYHDINHLHEVKFSEQDNWELVEQKPADKVEPKFKVGDWVVNNNGEPQFFQVTFYSWPDSKIKGKDNLELFINSATLDKQYHLWTIQDARDGDVLCCENGWTCIFKTLVNDETFSSYCFMDKTKTFWETGSECHTLKDEFVKAYNGEIHPATKEQRDLLFQKMKEAGYEWDAEQNQLRKIEQNPAWSEEDEEMLNSIIEDFGDGKTSNMLQEYWLKSLKDRVQPKQEWSEEDKRKLRKIFATFELYKGLLPSSDSEYIDHCLSWLKSLRPQNRWKPSKEQMNVLWSATEKYLESDNENVRKLRGEVLESLYEQLNKLREELL